MQAGRAEKRVLFRPRTSSLFDPSARLIAVASAPGECVWRLHSAGRQDCNSLTKRVKGDCLSVLLLLPASLRTSAGSPLFSLILFSLRIHVPHASPSWLKDPIRSVLLGLQCRQHRTR